MDTILPVLDVHPAYLPDYNISPNTYHVQSNLPSL